LANKPDYIEPQMIQGHMTNSNFGRCDFCKNYYKVTTKPKEIIILDRCFWEELVTEVTIHKNNEIIENMLVMLTVGPHQIAPYGFWRHTNNATSKENIFLNTTSNNFLEGTNYNYSCKFLNQFLICIEDFAMPEKKL
jgi:hypothetical protein